MQSNSIPSEIILWDIETTGFSPKYNEITQIAAVKTKDGVTVDTYNTMIDIKGDVPAQITELTGITKAQLTQNGIPLKKAICEFKQFCNEDYTIVAHNGKRFDSKFLDAALSSAGQTMDNYRLDSLIIAKEVLPKLEKHTMAALTDHFGISLVAHRADNDAAALAQVFFKMQETGKITDEVLEQAEY